MAKNEDDVKLVRAMYNARLSDKLVEMLRRKQAAYDKALRVSSSDMVKLYQGRAQELDDLIELFTSKE